MKIIKTVQIQITSHRDEIVETLHHFRDAANFTSQYINEHHVYNHKIVQSIVYKDIRERFGLRSQMTCNCIKQVSAKYIARKSRDRIDPIVFKRLFMVLDYSRDYRFIDENAVSINTIHGRVKATYICGNHQRELLRLQNGWMIKSAFLSYRKYDGKIFLHSVIERDAIDPVMLGRDGVIGIDLGIINVAVASDIVGHATFFGGHIKYTRWKYQTIRKEGQSKGTRSAKRRLRALSGRERRFVTAENHRIAKEIVELSLRKYQNPVIAIENLKGIRKNPRRTSKGRRELNSWTFFQLRHFIEYKAADRGIPVIIVNPRYTSQQCPRCGHIDQKNRDRKNHSFACRLCGYQSNDDRVGAMNIAKRAVDPGYNPGSRGVVNRPKIRREMN